MRVRATPASPSAGVARETSPFPRPPTNGRHGSGETGQAGRRAAAESGTGAPGRELSARTDGVIMPARGLENLAARDMGRPRRQADDARAFAWMATLISALVLASFARFEAHGTDSWPNLLVATHAIVFLLWPPIFTAQMWSAAASLSPFHRLLGRIAATWVVAMVVLGALASRLMLRAGDTPFTFTPLQMLLSNNLTLLGFAGLTTAAIVLRKLTDWHARLHLGALAMLLQPAIARGLPTPIFMPYAVEATLGPAILVPAIGMVRDWIFYRRIHPAWCWCTGVFLIAFALVESLSSSTLGVQIYRLITAGSPGAGISPVVLPPMRPWPIRP